MIASSRRFAILCVTCALTCTSCVPCVHPLCDEKNSVADELLIGNWLANSGQDDPPLQITIGKKAGAENVLEFVATTVDDEQHVSVERHDLFTTTVQSRRLAVYANDRDDGEPTTYSIWLLESSGQDTINIYALDDVQIAKAIEAKQLRGEVKRRWLLFGWHTEVTRISSTSDELREYLGAAGKKCFYLDSPFATLTRMR